jgi:hypothetical protein
MMFLSYEKEEIIIKNVSDLNLEEITELFNIYNKTGESQMEGDILGRIVELWDEHTPKKDPTIEQLKKQIKYSKNPLEVKMLNKKLNQIYKAMKKS